MPTDSQTLFTAAKCYLCEGVSLYQALKLALLAQIALNEDPTAKTDPQSLLTQAACFDCNSTASIGQLMELSLLAQISTATGVGGIPATVMLTEGGDPMITELTSDFMVTE